MSHQLVTAGSLLADNGVTAQAADATTPGGIHAELGGTLHKATTINNAGFTFAMNNVSGGATGSRFDIATVEAKLEWVTSATEFSRVSVDASAAALKHADTTTAKTSLVQAGDGYIVRVDSDAITLTDYPNTRDDATDICNVLYTDISGVMKSSKVSDLAIDRRAVRSVAAATTLVPLTDNVIVATGATAFTITLAAPTGCQPLMFTIKNRSTAIITVAAQGGSSIEGSASVQLDGTSAGAYSFANNGGEAITVYWSAAANEWIII